MAVALVLGAATGCSGDGATSAATTTAAPPASETTTTTEVPLGAGRQLSFYVPAVGDCFDVRPQDKAPVIYLRLDCSLPHQNEVFATVEITGGAYPGAPALETLAKQQCPASWEAYVGRRYELSRLEMTYFLPDQGSWGNGIRHVIGCLVVDPDAPRTTGSVRGTAQ